MNTFEALTNLSLFCEASCLSEEMKADDEKAPADVIRK